jgi:4-amino-4-deoxy-L-arabinose transferase-like glycosyltransferase
MDALPPLAAPSPRRPLLAALWTLLFLVGCFFLFFYRLDDRDLVSSHEARAAMDAQSVLSDGAWGLPRLFDRKVELQKPPLFYWLVALAGWCRGATVDAWAVRLPAAVGGLLGTLLLGWLGWQRGRPLLGWLAASVLATALHYTWLARTGRIDMPLTAAVTATLVAFYLAHQAVRRQARTWPWCLLGYVAAAAAVLLKGPIGLVLPAAVLGVWLLLEGEWRPWDLARSLGVWWGVPLFLALTVPWFVWANAETRGEFFRVFFWKHNLDRGFGTDGTLSAKPLWFYVPRLGFDFLPWSLAVPLALWLLWRRRIWRDDPEARFGAVWLLTIFLLLSCLRFKRADYLLPAYPGAALLVGAVFARRRWLPAACCCITLVAALGWSLYVAEVLPGQERTPDTRPFAAAVRRHAPAPSLVLFFRTENHALAYHVGTPIDTLLEWENLDYWAGRPEMYYVVMPPEEAAAWRDHLTRGQLQEVCRTAEFARVPEARPLVLLRTLPGAGPLTENRPDVRPLRASADRPGPDQPRAPGLE